MGANAQTTVPTFTASQVLTAAQQNQSARTGVPVFATTVTRDAAFGGTGEKTLAEGQLCYVEGTGLQTYNGTSWVTWGTAPITGGLVRVGGSNFTNQSTVSYDNVFTSTYENYMIIARLVPTAALNITMRLRASSSDNSTSNYNDARWEWYITGTGNNVTASGTSWFFIQDDGATGVGYTGALTVYAPQLAQQTYCTGFTQRTVNTLGMTHTKRFAATTQFDGFSLICSTSNMSGSINVYGFALS